MSSVAHKEGEHGHGDHDDGAVHAHVSPISLYIAIFLGLLFFTVLTVGQSYIDLGKLNIVFVVLIASLKASLVVTFFMHLKWDNKFNALIFVSCLFFIGVFFAYTLNDTDRRGELDPDQNVKVWEKTGEPAPGGFVPATTPTAAESERGEGAPHIPQPAEHH